MNEPAKKQQGKRRRTRRRIRTGDLVVAGIFLGLFLWLFLANLTLSQLFSYLFNPYAALVIVIIIGEFLWLKSSDRTRIYRLEADRLREMKRNDEKLLLRARDIVCGALPDAETGEVKSLSPDWQEKAVDLCQEIDDRL